MDKAATMLPIDKATPWKLPKPASIYGKNRRQVQDQEARTIQLSLIEVVEEMAAVVDRDKGQSKGAGPLMILEIQLRHLSRQTKGPVVG